MKRSTKFYVNEKIKELKELLVQDIAEYNKSSVNDFNMLSKIR
jgi:hypothetical protein